MSCVKLASNLRPTWLSLEVNQPAVAKMERRADMYVSNLRRFIEGMGGKLEIIAHFPEGSVTITNLSAVEDDDRNPGEPTAKT